VGPAQLARCKDRVFALCLRSRAALVCALEARPPMRRVACDARTIKQGSSADCPWSITERCCIDMLDEVSMGPRARGRHPILMHLWLNKKQGDCCQKAANNPIIENMGLQAVIHSQGASQHVLEGVRQALRAALFIGPFNSHLAPLAAHGAVARATFPGARIEKQRLQQQR